MRKYIIFFIILSILFISGCQSRLETFDGRTQGTTYHMIFEKGPFWRASFYLRQPTIEKTLRQFDLSLSTYEPGSVISRINRNDTTVRVDDFFSVVLTRAYEVWKDTDGAFDMTVGPLVNAFGFGPQPDFEPDSVNVDSLLQYVGMDKVYIKNGRLIKASEGVQLDANAIAQGYAVDVIAELFEKRRIRNYLVEIGGEIRTSGSKPGGLPWKVGIDRPVENNFSPGEDLQVILELGDQSLATSGNYRKFYERNGIKYAHSIDPRTGYPVMDRLLSATVIATDCMTADAYATAFMVMGLDSTQSFLENRSDLEVYLVYSDESGAFQIWHTPGFERYIGE